MVDPSHSASAIPAQLQALRERNLAWLRTSGMSGLLVVLVFGVFVVPAIVGYGAAWRLASAAGRVALDGGDRRQARRRHGHARR